MQKGTILFVGDVHLGRRPARVPQLSSSGLEPDDLSPRAAFEAVVREARTRAVDAVVFLGDVVDGEDKFLEVYGTLLRGVRELVDAGIAVLAVAGNHDVRALPRLADEIEGFQLVGRGGRWESVTVARGGTPFARLVGWSFPRARVEESPLAGFPALERSELPTLGILHADLDAGGGTYAPVARRDLEAAGLDGWLLGHVHAPSHAGLAAQRPLGYLGSLVGLDPTELGVHGPWLARFETGRAPQLEQLALAPLAWRALDIDVSELVTPRDELESTVIRALKACAEREAHGLGAARAVGCRARLVGQLEHHRELGLAARLLAASRDQLRTPFDERVWFLEQLEDATRAAHDLAALARADDLPGLVARRILALERADDTSRELVRSVRARARELGASRPWSALDLAEPSEEETRELLARAARATLDELLVREGAGT